MLHEGKRRADGRTVVDAALFLYTERRAAFEIDRAAERVGAFVRRVAFRQLELLEHRAGEIVDPRRARHAALAREERAIDGDRVLAGSHAANGEAIDQPGGTELAGDAR